MHLKPTLKSNMNHFFDPTNQPNPNITMGLITLQAGVKQPKQGYSYHKQDEFSYIISGSAHTILENGEDILGRAGDAQLIEKNEGHINYNDNNEPAVVVWFLVERKEEK
ncbi:cupin domain-containing protein [Tetragenococcus halophilus]|uniref:cupin domain-containing protein n=1 Tax=Tetragenococcus halophilus TaxID=51669 RepID=UPI001F3CA4B9|nr:cupin domain-containing protein [Tetragenococcus halophilus]MCF1685695.1 cupin domain-containing protein [Tetragenococcus halophilus]